MNLRAIFHCQLQVVQIFTVYFTENEWYVFGTTTDPLSVLWLFSSRLVDGLNYILSKQRWYSRLSTIGAGGSSSLSYPPV